jgi:hypothetical protein
MSDESEIQEPSARSDLNPYPTFMSQLRMIDREEQELTLASELTA